MGYGRVLHSTIVPTLHSLFFISSSSSSSSPDTMRRRDDLSAASLPLGETGLRMRGGRRLDSGFRPVNFRGPRTADSQWVTVIPVAPSAGQGGREGVRPSCGKSKGEEKGRLPPPGPARTGYRRRGVRIMNPSPGRDSRHGRSGAKTSHFFLSRQAGVTPRFEVESSRVTPKYCLLDQIGCIIRYQKGNGPARSLCP